MKSDAREQGMRVKLFERMVRFNADAPVPGLVMVSIAAGASALPSLFPSYFMSSSIMKGIGRWIM
jgi:hypothetical protein